MRVLIVNTSERMGGAAVAANRLVDALNNNGMKAKMLVRDKETQDITVVGLPRSPLLRWRFLWERWCIFCRLHFSKRHLWEIDTACMGNDITKLREFKEADVIHLSWVNQGMLSLKGIRKILNSGKAVVWTMHDIWPATAICHLTLGCSRFKTGCSHCKYLPGGGSASDLSTKIWRRKKRLLVGQSAFFVACSRWLEGQARQSKLLEGLPVTSIPNPIDTHVFHVADRQKARQRLNLPPDKQLILFASQRITNVNKGMSYLVEACRLLVAECPELKEQVGLVVLGGHSEEIVSEFDFPVYPLGYVNDTERIVDVYNATDLFVLPSLSENLPNTIMEAMACGVPCVGFRVGGIPEMIDHRQNGYVAEYRDAADLARGLRWVLAEADREELRERALRKVVQNYSQQSVAMKYIEVYNEAIAYKKYRL